jgi:hypothetical protein
MLRHHVLPRLLSVQLKNPKKIPFDAIKISKNGPSKFGDIKMAISN